MSDFSPIRIAVVASPNMPGLDALANDPKRGHLYELEVCKSIERLQDLGADYVILGDVPQVIARPLLPAYDKRILALHDADLTILDDDGRPRYTGADAVEDALLDGQNETRTTMYFVSRDGGFGPVFLLSNPFAVGDVVLAARSWGDAWLLMQYAQLHHRWMQRAAWGTLLQKAVEFLALGTVQIIHNTAWIDGVPGPCRLGHAPAVCAQHAQSIRRTVPASCPLIQE